ncbi:MAG: glycosyltransferase family 9 protein [Deltaproteobacteria bacterium]|jgi:heptosyltransferase-1/heptosyltransferase-2|nr:glycosyltransferase family 9 protein [Deltaproteobacteria bacterium]
MVDFQRILIIKMSALGDIVHALPSLAALRLLFPRATISWLVEPQFAALLPGPPYIDDVIVFRKNALRKMALREKARYLWNLRGELHARRFDLVLDLQGLLKSTLIALLSGCRRRYGYCEMREGSFLFTRPIRGPHARGHVIERYRDVVRFLGPVPDEVTFPLPDFSAPRARLAADLASMGLRSPLALLFPGAGWESKLWPLQKYAVLAQSLAADGLSVAIGGTAGDGPLAQGIIRLCPPPVPADLTGKTDLAGLMALTSLASVCLGADTGPLHLAAAAGTPTVSLFGPSSGERAGTYGPLGRYVSTPAPCSPCFKRRCPGQFVCMDQVGVGQVLDKCREVLALVGPKPLGPPQS